MRKIGPVLSVFGLLLLLNLGANTAEAQTLKLYPSGKIEVRNLVLVSAEWTPFKGSGTILGVKGRADVNLGGSVELKTLTIDPATRTAMIALGAQGSGSILGRTQVWGQKLNVLGKASLQGGLEAGLREGQLFVNVVGPRLLGPTVLVKRR